MDAPETSKPLSSPSPLNLFTFLSAGVDDIKDGTFPLCAKNFFLNKLEQRKVVEVSKHPQVKVVHIGDGVDDTTWAENICIFRKQSWRNNSGFVLPGLEVGIREKKEKSG